MTIFLRPCRHYYLQFIIIIHATTDLTRLLLVIAVLQMLCFTDVLVREFFRVNSRLKECRK